MPNSIAPVPPPINEPVRQYAPGSAEKESLKKRLDSMLGEKLDVPIVIGGQEIRTGDTAEAVCPHDHGHVLATYHQAGAKEVEMAAAAAAKAWREWSEMPWEARAAVMLRAAELLAGPWRDTLNAATMLNQSKTVIQAEIDAACELIDFYRFNVAFMREIYEEQPRSSRGIWNTVEYRALEGFVFAVTPFNFTAIAGNLPTAPALMGNTVLWKPASSAVVSGYHVMRLLEKAGMPPGVINFLPGRGSKVGNPVMAQPGLAGIHFTGSTSVFHGMWKTIGDHVDRYRTYPRIVGETGGKDFVVAHPSAQPDALVTALVRGSFEYQGQKCSAASRAYLPRSLWEGGVREQLADVVASLRQGSPLDFRNFMAAVIDADAFASITGYIAFARDSAVAEILVGGGSDDETGWFIEPTVVVTTDPRFRLMEEEIFGPVLTVYVYDDADWAETLELCDSTSPYALTGAVFADDRAAVEQAYRALRHAAGNFYVNDKPTGAVVGQQPFGGSRASGTNDKAGSKANLSRWCSVRSVKENLLPATRHGYPHMGEK
jgi:1-pyrroline-5-carboxylate dehydrogenase